MLEYVEVTQFTAALDKIAETLARIEGKLDAVLVEEPLSLDALETMNPDKPVEVE